MPSMVPHPAVPLALAPLLPSELRSPGLICLGVVCSVLPDRDVVRFRCGVPCGHLLGHRGLSHSMAFAACLSASLAWRLPSEAQSSPASRLIAFGLLFLSTLSHGVLEALTNGGLGVAFFAPSEKSRYFFPGRPMRVSPISVGAFLSATGVRVLRSEVPWVWLPAVLVAGLLTWLRRSGQQPWRYGVLETLGPPTPEAAQADAGCQHALAMPRRQQAKSAEGQAAMSRSRLWQCQGKRAEAQALLAPICGWFTEGVDTADLQEAQALLETLS